MKALRRGRPADRRRRRQQRQLAVGFVLLALWFTAGGSMSGPGAEAVPPQAGSPGSPATLSNVTYSTAVVKTKYGPLRGIVFRAAPVPIEGFLGVPYASPPIGSLRYMPPVTPSTWKLTRLVDRFAPVCPQKLPKLDDGGDPGTIGELPLDRLKQLRRLVPTLVNQSEDCLYLNLYVPHADDTPHRLDHLKPTIVYIHGESYEWNSGNHYDGTTLAMNGNVIVVTINFRLGVLGFLKTGAKGSAQGNFGLMDLVAGLHWLRENLVAFGGDPAKITLMGHGTGAALANILAVSPVAGDLIHRVVLLSGSALSPWAIQRDPLSVKRKVAEQTSCTGDVVNEDLAPCLRTKSLAELMNISLSSPRFLPGFAPFVDGTVITPAKAAIINNLKIPSDSAIAGTSGIEFSNFHKQDVLFGLTTYESYLELTAADLEFGFNETKRDRILRTFVRNTYRYHLNEIYSALKNEYTNWERSPRSAYGYRDAVLELLSDGLTAAPLVQLSHLHSLQGGRSYFLHFKHQSHEWKFPQRSGSVRGEDVPFALGFAPSPMFPLTLTRLDMQVSSTVMRYLCNFVKTGNPNGLRSSRMDVFVNNNNKRSWSPSRKPHNDSASGSTTTTTSLLMMRQLVASFRPGADSDPDREDEPSLEPGTRSQGVPVANPSQQLMQQRLLQYYHRERSQKHSRKKRKYPGDLQRFSSGETGYGSSSEEAAPSGGSEDDEREDDAQEETGEPPPAPGRDEDGEPSYYSLDSDNVYSGLTAIKYNLPFWGHYDTTNQVFMEIGNKVVPKSHYRGHKLSLWLSLIPQLHSSFNVPELSMRHHHFSEENPIFYDGLVREQIVEPPMVHTVYVTSSTSKMHKTETIASTILQSISTECPPNITFIQTASWPLPNSHPVPHGDSNRSLINRLTNSYHRSYSTALAITIGVGCFLLFLNVLIFVAIYYQREKRESNSRMKINLLELESRLHVVESSSGAAAAAAAATVTAGEADALLVKEVSSVKDELGASSGHAEDLELYPSKVKMGPSAGKLPTNGHSIQTIELSLQPHYHHGGATSMRRSSTSAIKHSHRCELQQHLQQQQHHQHHHPPVNRATAASPKKVSIVSPNPSDNPSSSASVSSLTSDHLAVQHGRETRSYSVVSLPKELCNQSTQYDLAELTGLEPTVGRPLMASTATMTRRRDLLRGDFRTISATGGGSTRSLAAVAAAKDFAYRDSELQVHGATGGILRPPSLHQLHHQHQHLHPHQQQPNDAPHSGGKKRVQIQEISV